MTSLILKTSARIITPAQVLLAAYYFLRGHNLPGGGFIGGLILAVSLSLLFLAFPEKEKVTILRLTPIQLTFLGLLMALAAGLMGLFTHGSFLAAVWGPAIPLPIVGKLLLGSVFLFDLGVFVLVLGMVLQVVTILRER